MNSIKKFIEFRIRVNFYLTVATFILICLSLLAIITGLFLMILLNFYVLPAGVLSLAVAITVLNILEKWNKKLVRYLSIIKSL